MGFFHWVLLDKNFQCYLRQQIFYIWYGLQVTWGQKLHHFMVLRIFIFHPIWWDFFNLVPLDDSFQHIQFWTH